MISDERTAGVRQDPPPPGQVPELPDLQPQLRHCRLHYGFAVGDSDGPRTADGTLAEGVAVT